MAGVVMSVWKAVKTDPASHSYVAATTGTIRHMAVMIDSDIAVRFLAVKKWFFARATARLQLWRDDATRRRKTRRPTARGRSTFVKVFLHFNRYSM